MTPLLPGIYCGPAPVPAELWGRWTFDPVFLLALAALALILRPSRPGLLGLAVLTVAFVTPLCALSSALFAARAAHHVLLVAAAAPLLALARPARPPARVVALLALTGVLWAWHLPALNDLRLSDRAAYGAMTLLLLLAAVPFWRAAFSPEKPAALLLILGARVGMGMLGALLTFAPDPLYAAYATAPLAWGLSRLQDQQLGGLLMWVPGGMPFLLWGGWVARRHWRALGARPA